MVCSSIESFAICFLGRICCFGTCIAPPLRSLASSPVRPVFPVDSKDEFVDIAIAIVAYIQKKPICFSCGVASVVVLIVDEKYITPHSPPPFLAGKIPTKSQENAKMRTASREPNERKWFTVPNQLYLTRLDGLDLGLDAEKKGGVWLVKEVETGGLAVVAVFLSVC